jgi:hypothetical protein
MYKLFAIAIVLAIASPAMAGEFPSDYRGRWGYLCMKGMQPDHVSGVCEKMMVPANINDARITKIDRVTPDRACTENSDDFFDGCDNLKKQNFYQTIIEKEGHNLAVRRVDATQPGVRWSLAFRDGHTFLIIDRTPFLDLHLVACRVRPFTDVCE